MLAAAFTFALWLVSAAVTHAEGGPEPRAGGPLRALVRLTDAGDDRLLARVRGQTNDLDVTLLVEPRAPLEVDLPSQRAAAQKLALARGARVVIWFRHTADPVGIAVHVADVDADGGRGADAVLVRWVEVPAARDAAAGAPEASALAEATALVVRLTLRALLAGGRIGVAPPTVAPVIDVHIDEASAAATRTWRWSAAVGWRSAIDGVSPAGAQALAAAIGAARGRLEVALRVAAGLPATLDDARTRFALARHDAGLGVAITVARSDRARLSVGGLAALALFARGAALSSVAGVAPTQASLTPAALLAPEAHLAWRPFAHRAVWVDLTLAADVLLPAPVLGYQRPDGFAAQYRVWPVQPRLGLAFRLQEPEPEPSP